MNILIFFVLTTAMVTAAPHAGSTSGKHQQKSGKPGNTTNHESHRKFREAKRKEEYLLKEIMSDVRNLKMNLSDMILQKEVQDVFMNEECNREMLCRAGNVLSAYTISNLGLNRERDWKLPRRLHAYSKNCTNTDELDSVPLDLLLDKINMCAQKTFANN